MQGGEKPADQSSLQPSPLLSVARGPQRLPHARESRGRQSLSVGISASTGDASRTTNRPIAAVRVAPVVRPTERLSLRESKSQPDRPSWAQVTKPACQTLSEKS